MKKKKQQFNFRFHNPNSEKATIDLLLSVFMEVNKKKVDEAIKYKFDKSDIDHKWNG